MQRGGRTYKGRNLAKGENQMWVANPVMVNKSDGKWRMFVDFTNINKACPKDGYPLPEIDWKVESVSRFRLKCFLDAYKRYHQIQMAKEDEDKTAFLAGKEVFCYQKMPFELKNVGATYQRQWCNKDLRIKLEYFSEEYDKEREMEPRPTQKEIVVEFEDAPNKEGSRVERNEEGGRPLGKSAEDNGPQGMSLLPLLAAHLLRSKNGRPLQSSLSSIHRGRHPSTNIGGILPPNGPSGLFENYTSCVTPFVRWIEDYPLSNRLKMPSHVGSYDRKGDPDNFLHLFEGAIASRRSLRRYISQYITSSKRKEKAPELSLLDSREIQEGFLMGQQQREKRQRLIFLIS
ncbi:hypothetical protein Tco_1175184 [Tanacetum coccineum]